MATRDVTYRSPALDSAARPLADRMGVLGVWAQRRSALGFAVTALIGAVVAALIGPLALAVVLLLAAGLATGFDLGLRNEIRALAQRRGLEAGL